MRIFTLCILFFIGCSDLSKTLPNSSGLSSEVIFVLDDLLWINSIQPLVQKTFGKSIEGINQIESLFRIIHVNHSEFKSILRTHKNIIIITQNSKSFSQENKWASGQFVAQLNWKKNAQKLEEELIKLRDFFVLKEINTLKIFISNSSLKKEQDIRFDNFSVICLIPKEYSVINNDSILFWANYNPANSDEIKNIFTFSFAPKSINLQAEVLHRVDSVFFKYLKGEKEGTYVKIETEYPPFFFNNTYRGLWRLQNGFMGGSFLIKTYYIKNKIVVNVGIVFAPQDLKRKYIKEFEAIL